MMRMIDQRTTMLQFDARKKLYTGIWLDIFPLDSVTPFSDESQAANFEAARELLIATVYPQNIKNAIENNHRLLVSTKELNEFIKKSYRQKGILFDDFMAKTFHLSGNVSLISYYCFPANPPPASHEVKNFDKTVYLPFENIELPAPANWKDCLTSQYGDWRKMIFTHNHASEYSADIPYQEYCRTSAFMK